jgi:hypothetical protein
MKKKSIILFIIILIYSCQPDLKYEIRGYSQKIMVEGYIANGEFPKVYLSLNVPLWKKIDSVSILENVIRTAKVTVSDGEKTEVLTSGFWDNSHFPPHVYKGFDIKGEEGKTYFLTVEYSGHTVHSQTTIPYRIESLKFESTPVTGNDSLRILSMSFNIDPTRKNAYRIFTKKKKDSHYVETPILYNAEFTLSGNNSFTINPKPTKKDSSYNEGIYFVKGETVQVKLMAIDSISTQFFKAMTLFSSTTGVGNLYFVGEKDALKSNISSPGFGIWCGNGTKNTAVIIQ